MFASAVMMGKVPHIPKEKCKDRFLVQSALYDGELPNDKFEWKSHFTDPNSPKDEIKLKCSYITSGDAEPAAADAVRRPDPTAETGVRQRGAVQAKAPAASPKASAPPAAVNSG